EAGDVLVSTVRPDRNVIALVSKTGTAPLVASNGFCLLRAKDIPPELLYAYCKTDTFRRLLARRATASMYPVVTDRDVLDMPFVRPPDAVAAEIVEKMRVGLKLLEDAKQCISEAIATMESSINGAASSPVAPSTQHALDEARSVASHDALLL